MTAPAAMSAPARLSAAQWTALGVLSVAGLLWLVRVPVAELAIGQMLEQRGIAHRLTIDRLDFGGAALTNIALGPDAVPDLAARRIDVALAWAPLPRVDAVSVEGLQVRGALKGKGLSFGALDRLLATTAPAASPTISAMGLALKSARLDLETPLGPFALSGDAAGRLTQNWRASGRLSGPSGLTGELSAASTVAAIQAQLRAETPQLSATDAVLDGLTLAANLTAAPDGSAPKLTATGAAQAVGAFGVAATQLTAEATGGDKGQWQVRAATAQAPLIESGGLSLAGDYALAPTGLTLNAALDAPALRLSSDGRQALVALQAPADTPFGPIASATQSALLRAGRDFRASAQGAFSPDRGGHVTLRSALISSASGAQLRVTPAPKGFTLAALRPLGEATLTLTGGGLPSISAQMSGDADGLRGRLSVDPFKVDGATLALTVSEITYAHADQRFNVQGALTTSGPLAGGRIEGLSVPLPLSGRIGDGFSLAPKDGCLPITAESLTAVGGRFPAPALSLCADGPDFVRMAANGDLSGGATVAGRRYAGKLDATGAPAELAFAGATLRFEKQTATVAVRQPRFSATLQDGPLSASAELVRARIDAAGVRGAVEGGVVDGRALPVSIDAARMAFATDKEGMSLMEGVARVRDRMPADADPNLWRPRFNPLMISNVIGRLDVGVLTTKGDVVLETRARRLGGFTAKHNLVANMGAAEVLADGLMFSEDLDGYDIAEPIRGVASDVRGRLDAKLSIAWEDGALSAGGSLRLTDIMFKTASIGPVEGVNGEIVFDDLLTLKSAPHQRFTVGRLDPGVGVTDGDIRFQILSPTKVRLEQARWPFAGGGLTVAPQDLDLSSRNFGLTLGLTEVNLADLLTTLGFTDLKATGRIAGTFPLRFSEAGAEIVDGNLESLPGGGTLSYTGAVSDAIEGPSRLAFDALQSFRFDRLNVAVSGRLEGDITGTVTFAGANMAPLRDVSALTPPGVPGALETIGLPFAFDVAVTAPFRQLVQSYQGFVDARTYTRQALDGASATPQPVDPAPAPPR